jgi:hypothetical protein
VSTTMFFRVTGPDLGFDPQAIPASPQHHSTHLYRLFEFLKSDTAITTSETRINRLVAGEGFEPSTFGL